MVHDTPEGPGLDAPSPDAAGSSAPRRWPRIAVIGVVILVVAALVAVNVIRMPYVIIAPGSATPLDAGVVKVTGAPSYSHRGDLLYLTVRVSNDDPSLARYLMAQLDDDVSIEPKENVIGCASYAASARLNVELMTQSQDVAKAVALQRLGVPVTTESSRAIVTNVLCDGPARGSLELGDVIEAVDGQPVATASEVGPLVRAHRPGETVVMRVRRGDDSRTVSVRLGDQGGTALLGIATQTVTTERFPFAIDIDTNRVSGPSAGLAFTLAIIDDLTPGDLTGGHRVAVTGSIQPDGSVAPVGGVAQKAIAARDHGATILLVPAGEAKAARGHGLKVVVVRTLDDALAALAANGGASIPAAGAGQ